LGKYNRCEAGFKNISPWHGFISVVLSEAKTRAFTPSKVLATLLANFPDYCSNFGEFPALAIPYEGETRQDASSVRQRRASGRHR
jgi:hypothetical protein